jgi:hypothetical protein
MRIQANTIILMGFLGCVFLYTIYALALFFIFVSRKLSSIGVQVGSRKKIGQKHSWIQAT